MAADVALQVSCEVEASCEAEASGEDEGWVVAADVALPCEAEGGVGGLVKETDRSSCTSTYCLGDWAPSYEAPPPTRGYAASASSLLILATHIRNDSVGSSHVLWLTGKRRDRPRLLLPLGNEGRAT